MKNLNLNWKKNDLKTIKSNNLKVFGTFVCGGGSTFGYKLSGFQHLGGVEIDKKMAEIYKKNHNPKHFYNIDIRDFNKKNDLPKELYDLDILDGSPPCTTFSMVGGREKTWGVKKKFKEGQVSQTLDDLVFVFCETALKLKPKVVVLENVTGIVKGGALKYAIGIVERLSKDYDVQIFKLDSSTMGVPQIRERVFFIARRKDLNLKPLILNFKSEPIFFREIKDKKPDEKYFKIPNSIKLRYPFLKKNDKDFSNANKIYKNCKNKSFFSHKIIHEEDILPTIVSSSDFYLFDEKRKNSNLELIKGSTFPLDFDFLNKNVRYVVGMSVPPFMIAGISGEIKKQWFNK